MHFSGTYTVLSCTYIHPILLQTDQGIKCLSSKRAGELSAQDPDYSIRDLYNAIARGEYPKYNVSVQIMTFAQAEKWKWNPFDLTKVYYNIYFTLKSDSHLLRRLFFHCFLCLGLRKEIKVKKKKYLIIIKTAKK
jgi:hypothetical protein